MGKDFLPLSRAFQNTTHTHTHTTSINPRQPRPCSWERNWPRSTPGYFGKALRTYVSCKRFFLPSALLTEKLPSSVGALGGAKGFQVSREKKGAQEPWRLSMGCGQKARE